MYLYTYHKDHMIDHSAGENVSKLPSNNEMFSMILILCTLYFLLKCTAASSVFIFLRGVNTVGDIFRTSPSIQELRECSFSEARCLALV